MALAFLMSVVLTVVTVRSPITPTDWARTDAQGIYLPPPMLDSAPDYGLQIGLWLAMTALLVWGQWPQIQQARSFPRRLQRRGLIVLVAMITLAGFALRVHTLDNLPLMIDEIGFAARASDMLHGWPVPVFAPGHNANSSVYSALLAGMMRAFGQNAFAIRLLSLFIGTLTIPAAYILGRAWWSGRAGVVMAAFVATYPAHIFFSRMALYNIADPLLAMLALALLRRRNVVAAGAVAGIDQYFYHGARLLPVLIALYVLQDWPHYRRHWRRLAFNFGVMALPCLGTMALYQLPLTGNRKELIWPPDMAQNSLRAILAWVGQPDISPFWLSQSPLLPVISALAFLVGFVLCLRYWRSARYGLLVVAIVLTTIFGGVIWMAAPLYVRYLTALPATALLVELGFQVLARWRWLYAAAALLMCAQGVWLAWEHPGEAWEQITLSQWQQDDLARQASQQPANKSAILIVPETFGAVERITMADYVAAYGTRRAIAIQLEGEASRRSLRLPQPSVTLRPASGDSVLLP